MSLQHPKKDMDLFAKYYTLALRQLTRRPRSEKEIHDYLLKKKATEDIIGIIIKKLHEQKFQDDTEFARWWIEQRSNVRAKSNRVITMELRQKGIDPELITSLLQGDTEDAMSDLDKARLIAQKKIKSLHLLPKNQQYQKLGAFLSRRGFDFETSKRVIDDILERGYNRD